MNGSVLLAVLLAGQVPLPAAEPQIALVRPEAAAPAALDASGQVPFAQQDLLASDAMRSDARLADVCFVDPEHGWAVGDRGTIWHTEDGGRHWLLQRTGLTCPLTSVCFVDRHIGWAVGGFSHPYTHTSSGVLLSTRDGGRHWNAAPELLLPALRTVRFHDEKYGWAIGTPSALFPTGVFTTDSGGRSWRPLSGAAATAWLAGDLTGPNTGALAGRQGAVATVRQGGIEPAQSGGFGLRNLTQMRLVAPVHGWLIGDGGLVMMTGDLGASWQHPPGPLPEGLARHFDFAAMAVRGPRCWIAGTPGSRVFHSPDAGRTWTVSPTGSPLPIHGLAFADDQHGWAVGALGTILATNDGGQTWQRQRAGGARAALLGLFSEGGDVPLELFAELSGNEGYLGVVEVLNRRDVEVQSPNRTHPADRLHEALAAVGASDARTAWRFPLRQTGLELGAQQIIEGWDRANDARGLVELEAHVVRQIRLWRPEVIVTHDASPRGDDPLEHLINQVVLQAVERAADPTWLPEQIAGAGLEPWEVKKVYASMPPGSRGSTEVTTAKLAARLGRSLADVAATPRGLLQDQYDTVPETLGFRLLVRRLPQEQGRGDFFSGLTLPPGGEARRELTEPPAEGLDLLRRMAQRRRNMRAILEQSERDPQGGSQLLAQAGELTRGLDSGRAGRVLYHLAQRYYQTGRWPLAAETFALLAEKHPGHPLSRPALLWLVQYYAGEETAWRVRGGQRRASVQIDREPQRYAVRQASALARDTSPQENGPLRAGELGKQIERTRPELFAEAALRFPLAAAHRKQGYPRQAERYYLMRVRGGARDAWWTCASGEQWLVEPKGLPPKSVLHCAAARAKPRLDGRLDDEVWQRCKPAALQSAQHDDAPWPAAVMLAYDDEFLYLAVNCRQALGAKYELTKGPRPRDPDLSSRDRVDVFLDLDRDFATYYRLTVDHRGWTGEACWGDHTWDPVWFVAADTGENVWTVEAAIPLDQLTGRYPGARSVWAVGIQRTVPGVGFQSWTTPATTAVRPEGFGYLIFD
ncbi:MAG: hypothetical protein JXB62_22675 [Pirellulales bacterium]|nr:hypothetical protein [Pirellulales bacterium]